MKKALSILLTAALLLTCLAGCGGAGSASPSGTKMYSEGNRIDACKF